MLIDLTPRGLRSATTLADETEGVLEAMRAKRKRQLQEKGAEQAFDINAAQEGRAAQRFEFETEDRTYDLERRGVLDTQRDSEHALRIKLLEAQSEQALLGFAQAKGRPADQDKAADLYLSLLAERMPDAKDQVARLREALAQIKDPAIKAKALAGVAETYEALAKQKKADGLARTIENSLEAGALAENEAGREAAQKIAEGLKSGAIDAEKGLALHLDILKSAAKAGGEAFARQTTGELLRQKYLGNAALFADRPDSESVLADVAAEIGLVESGGQTKAQAEAAILKRLMPPKEQDDERSLRKSAVDAALRERAAMIEAGQKPPPIDEMISERMRLYRGEPPAPEGPMRSLMRHVKGEKRMPEAESAPGEPETASAPRGTSEPSKNGKPLKKKPTPAEGGSMSREEATAEAARRLDAGEDEAKVEAWLKTVKIKG